METNNKANSTASAKDSEDCCIECGLLISSVRQIEQPGCCLCQKCADQLTNTKPTQ